MHAHWFPIILRVGSSKANNHGLASLMSLDHNDTYLPLMMVCSLVVKHCINKKGIIESVEVPSISKGQNKFSYTWDDFLAEYGLSFMEISHTYVDKQKTYFVRVGEFAEHRFSILE